MKLAERTNIQVFYKMSFRFYIQNEKVLEKKNNNNKTMLCDANALINSENTFSKQPKFQIFSLSSGIIFILLNDNLIFE